MSKFKYKNENGDWEEVANKSDIPTQPSDIGAQPEGDYEIVENKVTQFSSNPNDINYPSEKLVKDSLDLVKYSLDEVNNSVNYIGMSLDDAYAEISTLDANKVDKVTGKSLIADNEITRLATVTNQDLTPYETIANNDIKLAGKEPLKGSDDNYVTDAEKAALHSHSNKAALDNVSGVNTGDQDLTPYETIVNNDAKLATKEPANANIQTSVKKVETLTNLGGQLTGFLSPLLVDVSYNPTNRTVTLTGDITAFWQGINMTEKVAEWVSGWTSVPHNAADGSYFLYFNGTSFIWDTVAWDFKQLMIAMSYRDGANFCLRECHGLQDWQSHQAGHDKDGTYLKSGADLTGVTLNVTTPASRRPIISQSLVYDEDLPSLLPALNNGLYTRLYLSGANTANVEVDQTDIIENTAGNRFTYNLFTGGVWTKAQAVNNACGKIFLMAIPTTSDADCAKRRYVWIMPQQVSTTLATIQALTPASLSLGQIGSALAEYVFVQEIIVRATATDWNIVSTAKLTGNKRFQSVTSGNFLSSVAHDSSMTGDGTSGNPLATTAGLIPFTPSGNISATNVDGALKELDSEKLAITAKITTANIESVVDTVFQVPQYISFVATGDGIGVLGLRFETSISHTATISGGGFFYTDSDGTLGQSQTMNVVKGSNILYLRVTTDAVVKLFNVTKIDYAKNSSGNFPSINSVSFSHYINYADLSIYNVDKLSGVLTLPSGMAFFALYGSNTVSGVLTLPSGMTYFQLQGNNTVSGVLTLPSGMAFFALSGSNTVSGVLTLPSGMTYFVLYGNNTVSGILTIPSRMTNFQLAGNNTVSGILTIPSGMTLFALYGNNTVSGILTIPSGMTNFQLYGSNTVSGVLTLPSGMTVFVLGGSNTCSFNITNNPNACKYLELNSVNGDYTYNSTTGLKVWANGMRRIYIRPKTATWTTAMTDSLLIDLVTAGNTWTDEKTVDIRGNCGARTSLSDAAVATLVSYGVTVLTN